MTDDLDQLRERVRQNRAALSDELSPSTTKGPTLADGVRSTLVAGDQVRDRVTGQEGTIERGGSVAGAAEPLYIVRVPGGRVLVRAARDLERHPTPPAAA